MPAPKPTSKPPSDGQPGGLGDHQRKRSAHAAEDARRKGDAGVLWMGVEDPAAEWARHDHEQERERAHHRRGAVTQVAVTLEQLDDPVGEHYTEAVRGRIEDGESVEPAIRNHAGRRARRRWTRLRGRLDRAGRDHDHQRGGGDPQARSSTAPATRGRAPTGAPRPTRRRRARARCRRRLPGQAASRLTPVPVRCQRRRPDRCRCPRSPAPRCRARRPAQRAQARCRRRAPAARPRRRARARTGRWPCRRGSAPRGA